jgi:hypothetical protein
VHPDRLLYLDADLPKRLAGELAGRGRQSRAGATDGLTTLLDPPFLRRLAEKFTETEWVLVTNDDSMPADHGDVIGELGLTVATIDGRVPDTVDPDHWKREIVHRWAQSMTLQTPCTVRRYSLRSHAPWTFRKSRKR